jgi:hypothetical protein
LRKIVLRTYFVIFLACFVAGNALAQHSTPTIDGSVTAAEYSNNNSGNWYMTWDDTNLYLAKTGLSSGSNALIVYLDIDPLSTPAGGTNSNGSLTGHSDSVGAGTPLTVSLPFRSDARIDAGGSFSTIRLDNGLGGWAADNATGITSVTNGAAREISVAWTALGLSGRPAAFNWEAFELEAIASASSIREPIPSVNSSGPSVSQTHRYFLNIAATTNGSSTNPFSVQQSTWKVTSNADSGSNTLREAVTSAEADTASQRRYITFALPSSTTITLASNLPNITRTMTLDGTTQTGGTAPAVTIHGFSLDALANPTPSAFWIAGASGCEIRGFILSNHRVAILGTNATSLVVAGNYIGTNATGDAAVMNGNALSFSNCQSCTIGGPGAVDRNVIAGNQYGISAFGNSNLTIENNYIGINAAGTAALSEQSCGVSFENAGGSTIRGNVISGNEKGMYLDGGCISMEPTFSWSTIASALLLME